MLIPKLLVQKGAPLPELEAAGDAPVVACAIGDTLGHASFFTKTQRLMPLRPLIKKQILYFQNAFLSSNMASDFERKL